MLYEDGSWLDESWPEERAYLVRVDFLGHELAIERIPTVGDAFTRYWLRMQRLQSNVRRVCVLLRKLGKAAECRAAGRRR